MFINTRHGIRIDEPDPVPGNAELAKEIDNLLVDRDNSVKAAEHEPEQRERPRALSHGRGRISAGVEGQYRLAAWHGAAGEGEAEQAIGDIAAHVQVDDVVTQFEQQSQQLKRILRVINFFAFRLAVTGNVDDRARNVLP